MLSIPWVYRAQKARWMIDGGFDVLLPPLRYVQLFAELVNAP